MIKHLTKPIRAIHFMVLALLMSFPGPVAAVSNQEAWEDFVSQNVWGNSEDYWLEKNTAEGWEKVTLVMGHWNDWEGCEDVKAALHTKYPRAQYRCIPANKR